MNCTCKCQKHSENNSLSTGPIDFSKLEPILEKYAGTSGSLIAILQNAQDIYGYLPLEVLRYIAEKTGVKPASVYGVATFYTQFRLKPVGKHVILLCQGTACHVNGSDSILLALSEELKIKKGDTTADGLFTLETVACLGCCSLAPVMMIDGETYGKLTPDKARQVIKDIYKKEKTEQEV
jgi:NADH-quinone oxidoreductase subunit E